MKRYLFLLILFIIPLGCYAMNAKQDKDISKLWEKYEQAENADRPKDQMKILTEIKEQASARRLTYDYYRAVCYYEEVGYGMNWKLADELKKKKDKEIEDYDEPVLTFLNMEGQYEGKLADFIIRETGRLKAAQNREIWKSERPLNRLMPLYDYVFSNLSNDYEFVMWSLFTTSGYRWKDTADVRFIREKMSEIVAGKYPQEAVYEFMLIAGRNDGKTEAWKEFAARYEGKAVALFAGQELLKEEFLKFDDETTSEQYKAFYKKLEAFESLRASFKGDEAKIAGECTVAGEYMTTMKSETALIEVSDGKAIVGLRNLPDCEFILYRGKMSENETVYTCTINKGSKSFYAWDKVEVELPVIDDGQYNAVVKKGKKSYAPLSFTKRSLSLAFRNGGVFVADYKSGKPVEKVDLYLMSGSETVDSIKNFVIDGFTALPDKWLAKLRSGRSHRIYASCTDGIVRKSPEMSYFSFADYDEDNSSNVRAVIMKDCAAFNPGQTVKFKIIAYREYADGKMEILPEGTELRAALYSPDNKELQYKLLKLNEFGAANGDFVLENLGKHGRHTISVTCGKDRHLSSTDLVVDEYVLPTFTLSFDEQERLFLPGDEVEVSGVLKSYSGHSLSAADVSYTVQVNGEKSEPKSLEIGSDGRFSLSYTTPSDGKSGYFYCQVTVKVVDATGETLEFTDYRAIAPYIRLMADVENAVAADIELAEDRWADIAMVEGNASVRIQVNDNFGRKAPLDVRYTLLKGEKELRSGVVKSGELVEFALEDMADGLYSLKLYAETKDVNGRTVKAEKTEKIFKLGRTASAVDVDFHSYFRYLDGISVQYSAGKKEAWLVAELFDDKANSLKKELIYLPASIDGKSKVNTLSYAYDKSYTDAVVLKLFYFRDGEAVRFSKVVRRPEPVTDLKLTVNRFSDNCLPGNSYTVSFSSAADAEFLAAVFDKATETVARNNWYGVYRHRSPVVEPYDNVVCGEYGWVSSGMPIRSRLMTKSACAPVALNETGAMVYRAEMSEVLCLEDASSVDAMDFAEVEEEVEDVENTAVRENFATSLAFEPYLRADEDGEFSFDFTTSDKLSTFVCALYGHDREMNTVTERREFVVTLPVKVSAVQPQFLYEGDSYMFKASVSNSGKAVKGKFYIYLYKDNAEKASEIVCEDMELEEGAVKQLSLPVMNVKCCESLVFKAVFEAQSEQGNVSDAIRVTVPVLPAKQTITESHSAVLLSESEREAVTDSLRRAFVNTTANGASYKETILSDLLKAELQVVEIPEHKNVISLMDALYCNLLGGTMVADNAQYKLAAEQVISMLGDYVNGDGGLAWMQGMKSSVIVSALVAERIAYLRDRGLADDNLVNIAENAVKYIDACQFDYAGLPYWCGYLSTEKYLFLRSFWADVPFDSSVINGKIQKENFAKFKKEASDWLVGKDRSSSNGNLLAKYSRAHILLSLLTNENGRKLAKTWGIKFGTEGKLLKSLAADVQSFNQYAAEHSSGAWYFPNLVMPYRGILSSEAYFHALVCNFYYALDNVGDAALKNRIVREVGEENMSCAAAIADGIRLWTMIQKENQEWRSDAGFYDAIASVCDGSETLKAVKIISLTKKYEKPFEEIKAAGNGMGIEVKYYLNEVKPENEIKDGQVLNVGDKVVAQYKIWNEENRSFVRLSIPRPAAFRPEQQLSGWPVWNFYRIGCGMFWFTPMAYREVRARYTDYWFDVLPEENTVYTENFYVTQSGHFTAPVATVESLYAPHYRANDSYHSAFVSRD